MRQRGFTLVEMMITVAIAAILLSVAMPSFRAFIIQNQLATQANELVADLALVRSEALKRGAKVSICTSTNGNACTASSWTAGRMIFTDAGDPGELDGSDTVIRVSGALAEGLTLTASPAAIANYIQYSPTGEVTSNGNLTLCRTGITGRIISLSKTGRVSSKDTTSVCS